MSDTIAVRRRARDLVETKEVEEVKVVAKTIKEVLSCCCDHDTTKVVKKPKVVIRKDGQARHGFHSSLNGTLLSTLQQTVTNTCYCTQIYLGSPKTYNIRQLDETDVTKTAEYCLKHDKSFYVHAPLVSNLANKQNGVASRSYDAISTILTQIKPIPAACILHVGCTVKTGSLNNVADNINKLEQEGLLKLKTDGKVTYPLLVEVAAGEGTELGKSWHEMRKLVEAVDKQRVGLCLDTQHLFGSGMCSFENRESVVKLFDSVKDNGYTVDCIHLNDSLVEYKANVDRHAPVGDGHIWNRNVSSLKELVARACEDKVDIISETSDPLSDLCLISNFI